MGNSIPSGSTTTPLQVLNKHSSDITCCDFAPNFTLITCSSDKTVRIWEWKQGEGYEERNTVSPLRGHKYGVTCARVSPQGSMLATTSIDGTAILWNLHTGNRIHTMVQVNGDAVRCCRFSPDSSVLATAGDNGAICIWDLIHRSLIRTIFRHEGTTNALAFTPDSQYLLSACSLEVIHVWHMKEILDTTLDQTVVPLTSNDNTHDLGVSCCDFSNVIIPCNDDPLTKHYRLASSGNDHHIKLWTLTAKTYPKHEIAKVHLRLVLDKIVDGHNSAVTCVRFTSNGQYLVTSSVDKRIKVWDAAGNCLKTLEGHSRYVNCVAVSKDMELIASGSIGSNDKSVLIWNITGNVTLDTELMKSHMQLSQLAMMNSSGNLQEMEVVSNAENNDNEVVLVKKFDDLSEGSINSCAMYGNDLLAIGSGDRTVRLYKLVQENSDIEEVSYSPLECHTYSVNHIEFSKDGAILASCSMDGCTIFWDTETGAKIKSIPESNLGIRVCRISPNNQYLLTAGDDEIATIWDVETLEKIMVYEGHGDAITSACFSHDGKLIVTTANSHDFRLWCLTSNASFHVQEEAHDLGVQSCDISPNAEPFVNVALHGNNNYMLGTCGNDAMVKLWRISIPMRDDEAYENCEVKLWRLLQGHGGNVTCVRFSPGTGEIICSTATDRQARLWSVYGAECLHVLDHDSIVTACSFSADCSILSIGCLDKSLWLWKLPQQLVFQTVVANKIKCQIKAIIDWTTKDVSKWMRSVGLVTVGDVASNTTLDGQKLLTLSAEEICSGLDLGDEDAQKLSQELKWLKLRELNHGVIEKFNETPDEFLCPITHEIMRDPVICTDGFTYEKQAITEWFLSGKFTSPMTNVTLISTEYTSNLDLRNAIYSFLYNED